MSESMFMIEKFRTELQEHLDKNIRECGMLISVPALIKGGEVYEDGDKKKHHRFNDLGECIGWQIEQ